MNPRNPYLTGAARPRGRADTWPAGQDRTAFGTWAGHFRFVPPLALALVCAALRPCLPLVPGLSGCPCPAGRCPWPAARLAAAPVRPWSPHPGRCPSMALALSAPWPLPGPHPGGGQKL